MKVQIMFDVDVSLLGDVQEALENLGVTSKEEPKLTPKEEPTPPKETSKIAGSKRKSRAKPKFVCPIAVGDDVEIMEKDDDGKETWGEHLRVQKIAGQEVTLAYLDETDKGFEVSDEYEPEVLTVRKDFGDIRKLEKK